MPFVGTVILKKNYHRQVDGELSFSGALQESTAFKRAVGGVLSFTGNLTSAVSSLNLNGVLGTLRGVLTLKKNGVAIGLGAFRDLFQNLFHGKLFK